MNEYISDNSFWEANDEPKFAKMDRGTKSMHAGIDVASDLLCKFTNCLLQIANYNFV